MGMDDMDDREAQELEGALLKAGEAGQCAILAQDDMMTIEQVSELLQLPIESIHWLREHGGLLALELEEARYPAFQFEPGVREMIPAILEAFGPGRAWQAYDFCNRPEPMLSGRTPLDCIRNGDAEQVIRAARAAGSLEQGGY